MKSHVLIKLPFGRGAHPSPFIEDRSKALAARYQRLFTTLAANATTVVEASAKGALTHAEALEVLRRHVARLRHDLVSLDELAVQP
jgi:hypothetical protein